MAPIKPSARLRSKSTNQRNTISPPKVQESSQTSEVSQRSRAKNYSKEECEILVNICNKAHTIINKNSNSEADKKLKANAWTSIKTEFDTQCRAEGIYVQNRTIDQLQSKYKDLKKNARQVVSQVKRDIARTGNKPLESRTVRALSVDSYSMLLGLRKQIGPTATGFQSKYDSDAQYAKDRSKSRETFAKPMKEASAPKTGETEFGESELGQSSSNYKPRPIRERKQRKIAGSVDSQTMDLGSGDTSNDFSDANSKDDYEPSESNRESEMAQKQPNEMDIDAFTELAKELETQRMKNLSPEERMRMSDLVDSDIEVVADIPSDDRMKFIRDFVDASARPKEKRSRTTETTPAAANAMADEPIPSDEEWSVDRYLRLQYERDMEDAGPSGRLTAPPAEVRRRKTAQKATSAESNAVLDELRTKQIALVNEQLQLQIILKETALIAKEEAKERMAMVKIQRQIAEIDLKEKQKGFQ